VPKASVIATLVQAVPFAAAGASAARGLLTMARRGVRNDRA
jgi:hypothetical protein